MWFIAIFVLVLCSLFERVRRNKIRLLTKHKDLPMEAKTSSLTTALGELLAVAGGIYLTLVVIITFLEVQLPTRVHVGPICMEPLAGLALLLALLQPWLERFLPFSE